MKKRGIRRVDPHCSRCEYSENLQWHGDQRICDACLTCKHNYYYLDSTTPCPLCLRDYFTLWAFTGPFIEDIKAYVSGGRALGVPVLALVCWTYEEELDLHNSQDALQMQEWLSARYHEGIMEKDSASGRTIPASTSARSAPSPCPLIHHLAQRKTLRAPWDSSSK